jgi:hypothetical protein
VISYTDRPTDQLTVLRFVACDPALAAVAARQRALLHDAALGGPLDGERRRLRLPRIRRPFGARCRQASP